MSQVTRLYWIDPKTLQRPSDESELPKKEE